MSKLKAWINAARLRTLPLSISGIIVGASLANIYGFQNWPIFLLAVFTTISFQVTSNFANDYGDGVKGTDNEDRVGPKRALQSGILSRAELKSGIIIAVIVSLVLAIVLLFLAFGKDKLGTILLFLFLAIASIWAAIKYTVGNSAYGYKGLGDAFVFLFFGLLGVLGSMFLFTGYLTVLAVLPAITIGLLSTGVLNLNNLRDYISDQKANKNTLIVKMGFKKGKLYHYLLLVGSFLSMLIFTILSDPSFHNYLFLILYIPICIHALKVYNTIEPKSLDPELKKLALSTFFLAILFYISFNNFS